MATIMATQTQASVIATSKQAPASSPALFAGDGLGRLFLDSEDTAFWCPCQKCRDARFFSKPPKHFRAFDVELWSTESAW